MVGAKAVIVVGGDARVKAFHPDPGSDDKLSGNN